jgi:hypothetical protein
MQFRFGLSWVLVLGYWFLGIGSWFLGIGSWVLVLGYWFLGDLTSFREKNRHLIRFQITF